MTATPLGRHRTDRRSATSRSPAMIALLAIVCTVSVVVSTPDRADALLAKETFNPEPGVYGAVTVIGDSVLLGSVITSPTIGDQLAAHGWGPVRTRGGAAYSTGHFSVTLEARSSYWIELWRSQGWDPPNVLVNLGANDSGFCNRDLACARNAIMHLVDTIGPGHKIWWPQVTRHPLFQHQADNWNLALRQIADERTDFFTWDWPSVMAAGDFPSGDFTHLSGDGYRARSALMASELTADLAAGSRTGTDADLPTPVGELSELIPLDPVRVIDTRIDPPGRVPARTELQIDVSAHVPDGTTAIAAYVSATNTTDRGFLTAYECSAGRPEASAANHTAGETRGAVTITPVSPEGVFCLYTLTEADLLVDLQGAFVPAVDDGLRFDPLPTPSRLVDTRQTGRGQIIEVAAPPGAEAVAINIAAILSDRHGFLTAYPCSAEIPEIATVNYAPGEVISGTAFLPVSPTGTICVYVLNPTDVIIDLTGTFTADGALVFQPSEPTRTLDTRTGLGGWEPVHGQFQTIDARVAPPDARAVTGTLTIVAPARDSFETAWDCGPRPETSNINAIRNAVLANSVTTGTSTTGRLCFMSNSLTSTIFDTTGWWLPAT